MSVQSINKKTILNVTKHSDQNLVGLDNSRNTEPVFEEQIDRNIDIKFDQNILKKNWVGLPEERMACFVSV